MYKLIKKGGIEIHGGLYCYSEVGMAL